ncbi:SUMF1/EgtB/PvdO family nonheme iron enzyme [Dactylosporangium sp. NPDC050688]|uniref:formylglycine-generating enzyme family protein n=1 Tax=Dactylosporangium sp. NPDC050688 TaxID=3157217 RepID=UPI00340D1515
MLIALGEQWSQLDVAGRAAWRHDPSGVLFRLVPGGTFRMGLSDGEVAALHGIAERGESLAAHEEFEVSPRDVDDARPVREVTVGPLLLARHPLTVAQVRHWLPDYSDDYAEDDGVAARMEGELHDLLAVLPFRLPTEAEWEYAARAGTTTLTHRGDHVPDEAELLERFVAEDRVAASENVFGLAAMGSLGELCEDVYVPGYDGAPVDGTARTGPGRRVVRGGAADLSPWQGCNEWMLMLSAARGSHDMFAAVRPALDLPAAAR